MQTDSSPAPERRPVVDVLVVVDTRAAEPPVGLDRDAVAGSLQRRFPAASWAVRVEPGPGTVPGEPRVDLRASEVMNGARVRLLREDADVVVVVTDRGVVLHGRRLRSHASPVQRTAVLSTAPRLTRRRAEPAVHLDEEVAVLVGDLLDLEGDVGDATVLHQLADEDGGRGPARGRGAAGTGVVGRSVVELVRQVVASRPWLMTVHLSRTLVGASAAAFLAIVTPDFWLLADRMSVLRLALISLLVVLAGVVVLVVGGRLRERRTPGARLRSVRLHNTAVWLGVALGVLSLFAVLVVANLAVTLLVLPDSLVAGTVGHQVGWGTLARIGIVTAIVSLVGSVFGAGLEDDEDVQDATFGGSDDARFADDEPEQVPPG